MERANDLSIELLDRCIYEALDAYAACDNDLQGTRSYHVGRIDALTLAMHLTTGQTVSMVRAHYGWTNWSS